jgi:PAS domain S-box-containing protein
MHQSIFHSLAVKIGAIVILIEIIVLSIMGGFYVERFSRAIDQRVEERVRIPGSLMAQGVLSYSLVSNREWMERLVGQELVEGMVLNIAQRVFYTLDEDKIGTHVRDLPGLNPAWFTKEIGQPFVKQTMEGPNHYLISVTPIFAMDGRTPFLFIYLKVNTTRAAAEKATILRLFLLGSLLAVTATSLAIFFIFKQSIFSRIQSILQILKKVEKGDLTVPSADRIAPDEIGNLQNGVASMVAKLEETITSLRITQFCFDNAAVGIFRLGADARILMVNDQAARSLGYTKEALAEMSIFDIDPFVNNGNWPAIWQRLIDSGGYDVFETRHRRKDGREIMVEITSNLLEYEDQPFSICFVQDITERKRAKRALEESERRYRDLFNEAPVMYVITDNREKEPYIRDVNKMFLDLLGYRREEVINTPLARYYTEDSIERMRAKNGYRKVLEGDFLDTERDLVNSTDNVIHTLVHSLPEYNAEGKVSGTRVMFLDITVRKHAESEAKRLEAQLLQAQKMEAIGTLAGGIAHDFNNILSAVIGYSELALYDVDEGSPAHRNLRQIYTAGLRARDLVQQILTFSRKDERELGLLPPVPLVKEALKLLRSSLPTTIEIHQRFESDDIAPILADPTQIHQIIMNMCTNAAHAMEPDGGRLEVVMSQVCLSERDIRLHPDIIPGHYLKLSIQDTGRGIPPEIMPKIYDPYFSTKEKGKGTGLGLAVVHGIVQNLGGTISAYSEPNCGTTFNIYIPSQLNQPEMEKAEEFKLPFGCEHILLVDDEPAILDIGEQLLKRLGYRVSVADGSVEALEMFRQAPQDYDMVLTDMTMPKMTGDRLSLKLLAIRPDLPIILCTGFSVNISAEKALEMGIKAFIYKPIVEFDLARIIRKVLDAGQGPHPN